MTVERAGLRGVVLAEDKRTERFFRCLLGELGFSTRRFRFVTAPSGKGAGDAFVARRYAGEVRALRSKNYQKGLRLIAVRDEDGLGIERRKRELDQVLEDSKNDPRKFAENIATPVPARNIEAWLLALIGEKTDESADWKQDFERRYRDREREVLRQAAANWHRLDGAPPSLQDGRDEMRRIE